MSGAALACLLALLVGCAPARPASSVLRVGTSGDYAPFSIQTDAGWQGLDVEIARRFAHDTGRRLELVEFRWPALELDLAEHRFDVAMSGVTMRPWRARVGTFTRPVVRVGAMALTWPTVASTAHDLDGAGHRIGVNNGGYLERVARRLFPRAEVVPVADNRLLAGELQRGSVDAIVSDELEAPLFLRVVPTAVALGPLTNDRKAYLARDPALAEELDAWLRAHEADGSLATMRAWALGPAWAAPRTAAASDVDALLALIDLREAFMPAVAQAKLQAGLPTTDPAQEDEVRSRARERAQLLGAPVDRIDALVTALLAASRDIQDDYRRTPAEDRPPVESMDLATEARPALARVSASIVDRAAAVAKQPLGAPRPSAAIVADSLDASVIPAVDRLAIAEAVVALSPAE